MCVWSECAGVTIYLFNSHSLFLPTFPPRKSHLFFYPQKTNSTKTVCIHECGPVCVCLQFPFITPQAAAGRNHLILSLHGRGHSKERCLQGICLKSTQTYCDTLGDKHVATISVPSPQYTGFMGHRPLWGVGCYCPLLAKGGTATLPAKVSNLLMNKQHDHKLQLPRIPVTLGFSNYSVY